MPGNRNGDLDGDGWETGVAQAPTMPPLPHQPALKKSNGEGDHTMLHRPQQQFPLPPSNHQDSGFGAGAGARKSSAAGSWGHAKIQQPQDVWTPEDDRWAEDDGWDEQENDDGWEANDDWNNDNSEWGQQPHSAAWTHAISGRSDRSRTASNVQTSGWQSWGEEAQRLPKVTFDPAIPPSPSSTGSKPVLSQNQRSQILNALLNSPQQNQQPYPMIPTAGASVLPAVANNWQQHQPPQHGSRPQQQQYEPHQSHEHRHRHEGKKNTKGNPQSALPQGQSKSDRRHEEVHDVWGLGDGWNDLQDEEEQQDMTQDAWGRRVHFSPGTLRASMLPSSAPTLAPSTVVENLTVNALPQNKLGLSTIPMSKTLSYAYSGTTPSTESEPGRAAMQRIRDVQFIESRGEALKSVQHAFYGKQRKAADRFHWLFSPEKDERVSSLLTWINSMSFGIASFGVSQFIWYYIRHLCLLSYRNSCKHENEAL